MVGGAPLTPSRQIKGVNFEVSEVEVDVDGVETNEEVDEGFLLLFGYML
jgi:hypothetical protein